MVTFVLALRQSSQEWLYETLTNKYAIYMAGFFAEMFLKLVCCNLC